MPSRLIYSGRGFRMNRFHPVETDFCDEGMRGNNSGYLTNLSVHIGRSQIDNETEGSIR
jgi:hypothetical protein